MLASRSQGLQWSAPTDWKRVSPTRRATCRSVTWVGRRRGASCPGPFSATSLRVGRARFPWHPAVRSPACWIHAPLRPESHEDRKWHSGWVVTAGMREGRTGHGRDLRSPGLVTAVALEEHAGWNDLAPSHRQVNACGRTPADSLTCPAVRGPCRGPAEVCPSPEPGPAASETLQSVPVRPRSSYGAGKQPSYRAVGSSGRTA